MKNIMFFILAYSILSISCGKEKEDIDINYNFEYVLLNSQNDIDSFSFVITHLDRVSIRELEITGELVNSLEGLSNKLQNVGLITIQNTSLKTLQGLGNIEIVSFCYIKNNLKLKQLNIEFMDTVIADLEIVGNDSLLSLDGLNNLTRCFRLKISDNKALLTIDALNQINMTNEIILGNNDSLSSLSGLGSLKYTGSYEIAEIYITDNNLLKDFCELKYIATQTHFTIDIHDNYYNPTIGDLITENCKIE
jgi:hypothetical protein